MNHSIESESAMKSFGERLGRSLKGGECIELVGDVGAGKTTLTKGLAVGLGITETVQSPTFTINRTYEARDGLRLAHYDFYRLSDPGIMADELAEATASPDTVIVIEWGDIIAPVLPADHLRVAIESPSEHERSLSLTAHGPSSQRLVEAVA